MASTTDQIKAQEEQMDNMLQSSGKLLNVSQYEVVKYQIQDYNQKAKKIAYRQALLRKMNDLAYQAVASKHKGFMLVLSDQTEFTWQRGQIDKKAVEAGNFQAELKPFQEKKTLKQLFREDDTILQYLNQHGYQTEFQDQMHLKILLPPVETVNLTGDN